MAFVDVSGALKRLDALQGALEGVVPTPQQTRRILAKFRAEMLAAIRREALPEMREATPKDSGQAARSFRAKLISRPVYGIEVGPGRKGFYLRFHPDREALELEYRNILNDVYRRHAQSLFGKAVLEILKN